MITTRIFGFVLLAVVVLITFIRNTNKWAISLQTYFANQPKNLFTRNDTWKGPVGLIIAKAMIIFLGFMLIVAAYILSFQV
jgi:hypothetical protein